MRSLGGPSLSPSVAQERQAWGAEQVLGWGHTPFRPSQSWWGPPLPGPGAGTWTPRGCSPPHWSCCLVSALALSFRVGMRLGFRPGSVAPIRSGLCVHGRWELAAPSRQRRRGRASSRAPEGRGEGGVDPSRESEQLPAGPPSPRPRRPSFLPLTPGRAGGCWTGTDKSLADWPRLIRSRADPGGNRRAGISERWPHSSAPGRRGTERSPGTSEDPDPLHSWE